MAREGGDRRHRGGISRVRRTHACGLRKLPRSERAAAHGAAETADENGGLRAKDDADRSLFPILEKNGFKTGVLNHPGSVFKCKEDKIFDMPRIGLTDETELSKIESLIEGKLHLDFNGLNKKII